MSITGSSRREGGRPQPLGPFWRLVFWAAVVALPLVAYAAVRAWYSREPQRSSPPPASAAHGAPAETDARAEQLRRLEEAVRSPAEQREFDVRWVGFRVDHDDYRRKNVAQLEPGPPDVFLRVGRTRGGQYECIFDGRAQPIEDWSREASAERPLARFRLPWARGDGLRLELWDKDQLRDNPIDSFELQGGLAILSLATPLRSAAGNTVTLRVD